jgi:hypothetical protein
MKQTYFKKNILAYLVPALTASFFLFLIGISIFSVQYKTRQFSGDAMASDIMQLATIFDSIHKDCTILSFDYQKNPINFLNVRSFSGSEVGPMNLVHPEHWKGPYVQDNLAMQNKEYQIVRTNAGYFIVPGQGVKLPNGQIVGEDIHFDEQADIAYMMLKGKPLHFNDKPLAAQLKLQDTRAAIDLDDLPNVPMGY